MESYSRRFWKTVMKTLVICIMHLFLSSSTYYFGISIILGLYIYADNLKFSMIYSLLDKNAVVSWVKSYSSLSCLAVFSVITEFSLFLLNSWASFVSSWISSRSLSSFYGFDRSIFDVLIFKSKLCLSVSWVPYHLMVSAADDCEVK